MNKKVYLAILPLGLALSGCVGLLGAGAGAAAVACTDDDVNCPPTEAADQVEQEIDDL